MLAVAGMTIGGIALWKILLGILFGGATGYQLGKSTYFSGKEMGLKEKGMEHQIAMGKAGQEATSKQFDYLEGKGKEDRALMLKLRREEKGEAREERAMTRQESRQDRQTAMIVAMMQNIMSNKPPVGEQPFFNPNSMTSLLR